MAANKRAYKKSMISMHFSKGSQDDKMVFRDNKPKANILKVRGLFTLFVYQCRTIINRKSLEKNKKIEKKTI